MCADNNSLFTKNIDRMLLAGAVAAVYLVTLANGFVWDDRIFFIGNPVYKGFNLKGIFLSLANGVEYLPLRDLTYALDYLFWGEVPSGFHFTQLLFFVANVLLAYELSRLIVSRLAGVNGSAPSRFTPFAAALLFAVHPINSEAANFITCRNVVVSGVFFFIAVIGIIRHFEEKTPASYRWYAVSLLAFTCAMLSKATVIMLPVLLTAVLPQLFPGQLKRISILCTPFFLLAGGFFLAFKTIADKAGLTGAQTTLPAVSSLEKTVAQATQIPVFYLKKLLLPFGFSVEYATGFAVRIASGQVVLSVILLGLIAGAAILLRRKAAWLSLGAVWFIVSLLPVLNFFATHPVVADRYLFLPSFGFMLVVAASLDQLCQERIKRLLLVVAAVLLAVAAVMRSLDWRSDETLWKANIRNFPAESKGYLNLAAHYFNSQQQRKAVDLLAANVNLPWLTVYLDYYEGKRLFALNDFPGAKAKLQKALDVVNGFTSALYFLGAIAEKEGDYVSAAQYYNRALVSGEADAFFERPAIKERLRVLRAERIDQSLAGMKRNLEGNPTDYAAHKDLAMTLDRLGFYEEAVSHYLTLERAGIHGWQIYHNIGNCYFNMNRSQSAVLYYEKAAALGSSSEDTFNNLGIAYRKLNSYGKSIHVLERAITLFPAAPYPQFNLGVTYFDSGETGKARAIFSALERNFPEYKDKVAPYLQK